MRLLGRNFGGKMQWNRKRPSSVVTNHGGRMLKDVVKQEAPLQCCNQSWRKDAEKWGLECTIMRAFSVSIFSGKKAGNCCNNCRDHIITVMNSNKSKSESNIKNRYNLKAQKVTQSHLFKSSILQENWKAKCTNNNLKTVYHNTPNKSRNNNNHKILHDKVM